MIRESWQSGVHIRRWSAMREGERRK